MADFEGEESTVPIPVERLADVAAAWIEEMRSVSKQQHLVSHAPHNAPGRRDAAAERAIRELADRHGVEVAIEQA